MSHSPIFSTQKLSDSPILIIDKKGILGEKLANNLFQDSLVILVSGESHIKNENLIHIPFLKKNPTIPDNTYSQIIIIDENLVLEEKFIKGIFKNASKNHTPLFLGISHKEFSEKLFTETVLKYPNVSLGILGDIFASNFIFDDESEINKIIFNLKKEGVIRAPRESEGELFPIFLEDVVSSILKICFSQKKVRLHFIMPKTPITSLMLATIFKKNFPDAKLDFIKLKTKKSKYKKTILTGNYVFGDDYKLSEKIKNISLEKINAPHKDKKNKSMGMGHPVFFTLLFFLFLLILPILSSLLFGFLGKHAIYYTQDYLKNGDNKKAEIFASLSQGLMLVSVESGSLLSQEIRPFGGSILSESISKKTIGDYYLSKAYLELSIFLNKANVLISGKSSQPFQEFTSAASAINSSNINYNLWQQSKGPNEISDELEKMYLLTSSVAKFLPEILGFNNRKTVFIYLNSNQEPTSNDIKYYLMYLKNGEIIGNISESTKSALLSQTIVQNKANIVIEVNQKFIAGFGKHLNRKNLITLDALGYLSDEIKNKNLVLLFDNPLIQEALNQID